MTNEQASEQYAQQYGVRCESNWYGEQLAEAAFLAGIEYAEGNRWVRVEDALPKESGFYLVYMDRTGVCVTYFSLFDKEWSNPSIVEPNHVTHWQQLPKAPINAITAPIGGDNS